MKYKYRKLYIGFVDGVLIFMLYGEYKFHLFIFAFEHYPNFKLKILPIYCRHIHIAYYGCNGLT